MPSELEKKVGNVQLYRAGLSCKIGMDAIDKREAPCGASPLEYAVYNLLSAVQDIAKYLSDKDRAA